MAVVGAKKLESFIFLAHASNAAGQGSFLIGNKCMFREARKRIGGCG